MTAVFLGSYGMTLLKLDRYADAEGALLDARRTLEAVLGTKHKRTVTVTQSLADLYDAWHAAEPDQGYDQKAAEWRAKLTERQATTQPATAESQPADAGIDCEDLFQTLDSHATVERSWKHARAWLRRELAGEQR